MYICTVCMYVYMYVRTVCVYVCMYVGFQVTDYTYRGSVCTHIDWLYCRDDDEECQSAANCFLRLRTNN